MGNGLADHNTSAENTVEATEEQECFCVDRKLKAEFSVLSPFFLPPLLSFHHPHLYFLFLLGMSKQLCVAMVITVFPPPLPITI